MFGEKTNEDGLPVWQTPKYEESKKKALELINSKKYGLSEADFWILKNKYANGKKIMYSGLIISHNGCLKINANIEKKLQFNPLSVSRVENGYNESLVYEYCNAEQGLYEVGEVSKNNLKNVYPYAMALKRLFDRVVLKTTKIAYSNIYSEVESDEFARVDYTEGNDIRSEAVRSNLKSERTNYKKTIKEAIKNGYIKSDQVKGYVTGCKCNVIEDLTEVQLDTLLDIIEKRKNKKEKMKNGN